MPVNLPAIAAANGAAPDQSATPNAELQDKHNAQDDRCVLPPATTAVSADRFQQLSDAAVTSGCSGTLQGRRSFGLIAEASNLRFFPLPQSLTSAQSRKNRESANTG
jgi:hypothetical protein